MTDKTTQAVAAQIEAMGCTTFEVGVFNATKERMLTKVWDRETIMKSVPYLKYQNMQGNHIYIRPAGAHNLTMVDDLDADKIRAMKRAGHSPALVVETSPNNFQAWLKHHKMLPTEVSTRASKEVATLYGGDPSSADWRHYGRLAGFTNCKKKYQQPNGLYPFVVLKEASGKAYDKSAAFVAEVEAKHEAEQQADKERRAKFSHVAPSTNHHHRARKTINDFRNDPRYAGDYHRAELGFATYAIARGVGEKEVIAAIMTRDLSHKGNAARQDDYAERTVKKAIEITQNQPAQAQQSRDAGRSR